MFMVHTKSVLMQDQTLLKQEEVISKFISGVECQAQSCFDRLHTLLSSLPVRFTDKADQRAEPGTGWTPAELNHILQAHVVDGALSTFGCVEWGSDLCRGVMCARCYTFDMPKHLTSTASTRGMYTTMS